MNILLLASHAVAEYDDLRMFTDLGYDCFAPGGYEVPSRSGEGIRPALPDAPHHPDFVELCNIVRNAYGEPGQYIDWAKALIDEDIIDWADAIIVHHFPRHWIGLQWDRIKHKRVIWRTCGQSDPATEQDMAQFRADGLQIVRYSPAERRHFERLGCFAGEDALIRFGKYPDDYGPWIGDQATVGNVTQDFVARGESVGYPFWLAATEGLPRRPVGKGSDPEFEARFKADTGEELGPLPYEMMLDYLRHIRTYLYTGTRPASYTLALIEAMLSGVPVVSIGPKAWGAGWDGEDLFEGHEIVGMGYDHPADAKGQLQVFLDEWDTSSRSVWSEECRQRAIELFDVKTVGAQWQEFLS